MSLQNVDLCQKESFWLVLGINYLVSLHGLSVLDASDCSSNRAALNCALRHDAGFDVAAFCAKGPLLCKRCSGHHVFVAAFFAGCAENSAAFRNKLRTAQIAEDEDVVQKRG